MVAGIGLAAPLLGGVVGAVGSIFGGEANASMYGYQASVARLNAQIAHQNAAYELALGESQAQQQGMKTRGVISQTRAMQGASGLDVNTGTSAEVRKSELQLGQFDQAVIRNNAARRAYGQEVIGFQEEAQARLYESAASTSRTAGLLGGFTSILGGVGSFSSKWMQGKALGLWGKEEPDEFGGE